MINNKVNQQYKHTQELGIYIHIPFCVQKCKYCDFLSEPARGEVISKYIYALAGEINTLGDQYKHPKADTVFIGGGTPSILEPEQLEFLLEVLHKNFPFAIKGEFTMECNPGTLTQEKVKVIKRNGINRISLGLQSADNEELKRLGRIHTYEEFLSTYELLRQEGFHNINIDLMSALPYQDTASWEKTLRTIVQLSPEHISAYSLIVEEGTALFSSVMEEEKRGVYSLPSEGEEREMYYRTQQILKNAGYYHYEISNYAKPGFECRHNSSYWIRKNYLGMGLGAASLMDNIRYTNIRDLQKYLDNTGDLKEIQENEMKLSRNEQMEEFMFLGLRLLEGVSIKEFEKVFQKSYIEIYGEVTRELKEKGLILEKAEKVLLTEKGLDLSNYVMSEFLF